MIYRKYAADLLAAICDLGQQRLRQLLRGRRVGRAALSDARRICRRQRKQRQALCKRHLQAAISGKQRADGLGA